MRKIFLALCCLCCLCFLSSSYAKDSKFLRLCKSGNPEAVKIANLANRNSCNGGDDCDSAYRLLKEDDWDLSCDTSYDCSEDMRIHSLEPLAEFHHISSINLFGNTISDISLLKSILDDDAALDVSENLITDFSALQEKRFIFLGVGSELIDDAKALELVQQIQEIDALNLSGSRISNLDFLSYLPHLSGLGIADTKVRQFERLLYGYSWRELALDDLELKQIDFLSPVLKKLRFLSVDGNQISDLSVLNQAKKLDTLFAANNQIKHFDINHTFYWIDLGDNQLSALNIKPAEVNFLELANNQLRDVSTLTNLIYTQGVTLMNNPLSKQDCLLQLNGWEYAEQACLNLKSHFSMARKKQLSSKKNMLWQHVHRQIK